MPIECPSGGKAQYRVARQGKQVRRLALCGDKVVENMEMRKNSQGKLKVIAEKRGIK